jgi:antitoxin HicB
MEYPAKFEPAPEGGYVITFPDFDWGHPGGYGAGSHQDGGRCSVHQVQEHIRNSETLPRPSQPRGSKYRMVRLPVLQGAKAELYREFAASGIRKAELAWRLGIPKGNVDRLFDLKHHSRLDQIEAAFQALGKELTISVQPRSAA